MAQRGKRRSIDSVEARQRFDAAGQLHGLSCAVRLQLLEQVAEIDKGDLWIEDGASSTEHWLRMRLDMSRRSAHEFASVARVLMDLPRLAEAHGSGALSWDKLVALCSFATADEDAGLAKKALEMTLPEVKALAAAREEVSLEDAEKLHRSRAFKLSWSRDKSFARPGGILPAEDALRLEKALDRERELIPPRPDGTFEPFEARTADALIRLASARIAGDADPDLATMLIDAPAEVLGGLEPGTARLENGAPIHLEAARRLSCDCRPVFVSKENDSVVGISRADRNPPPWLRRYLKKRDRCCGFPSCGGTKFLHAHHLHHWTKGGRTDADNLILLCPSHHRLVHEGGWSMRGDPEKEVVFVRPDGRDHATGPPLLRQDVYDRIFSPEVSGPLVPA